MTRKIFHMLIETSLKRKLINLKLSGCKTISGKINLILRMFFRNNRRVPGVIMNQMSIQNKVSRRREFNLSTNKGLYRIAKKYHARHNYFSIALLIRSILWYYLYLHEKYDGKIANRIFEGEHKEEINRCFKYFIGEKRYSGLNFSKLIISRWNIARFVIILEKYYLKAKE